MGVDSKKLLPLPAPTETTIEGTPSELTTTDLSLPGDDQSSYSIPDDGTPVTIRTRGHRSNKSQTSLLIEYFEGGRSSTMGDGSMTDRKPSVRVRLTPSRKGRGDRIQLTESKGTRKASVTRRIALDQGPSTRDINFDDGDEDMTPYASATEESNVSRNPNSVDIEIDRHHRRRRPASPLIPNASYHTIDASEISAIPTDSFLDGSGPDYKNSPNPSRGTTAANSVVNGKTGKERSKASASDRTKEKAERKRRSKSRASNVTDISMEDIRPTRHRASRGKQESNVSGPDGSVLSSNISPSHRSTDGHSMRSGTSKSSINNPKLLETVEDAIRRLILPELSALKREQSKRETRRDSLTSTVTSVSKDDLSTPGRRRSMGQRSTATHDGGRRDRRNREARHDFGDASALSSRESMHDDEEEYPDDGPSTPKQGGSSNAGAALTDDLSLLDDESFVEERRPEKPRRRNRSSRSRSMARDRYDVEDAREKLLSIPAPQMPLMSEINPSDITRTSILSADTETPMSVVEESIIEEASHVLDDSVVDMDIDQPTAKSKSPDHGNEFMMTLGTSHANVSHGDLTALPRGNKINGGEGNIDEYGNRMDMDYHHQDLDDGHDDYLEHDDYADRSYEGEYYNNQDVPSPLNYVPYQAGARGLSPIPSVSGYTDGASEAYHPRHSLSIHSAASNPYHSRERGLERGAHGSNESLNSIPSNIRNSAFDQFSADERSGKGSGVGYRNSTFTEDSELGNGGSAQEVRGAGANPNIIHQAFPVESAVASLIDGSMLEQSVLTSGSGYAQRDSVASYEQWNQTSRGQSPAKRSVEGTRDLDLEEERIPTPGSRSRSRDDHQEFMEYDVDEFGRKIPRAKHRQSPTASEAAITVGAVGAAAAALKAAQGKNLGNGGAAIENEENEWVGAGVGRNKSFKERTMDGWEPRNTPSHSVDRFSYDDPKVGASYMPNEHDAMPEIGYIDDEITNPSIIGERMDEDHHQHDHEQDDHWGRTTPAQQSISDFGQVINSEETPKKENGNDHDEWQRTSDERKRDTLLTNPYEDASPIANPVLGEKLLAGRGLDAPFTYNGSPGFGQKFDEGYMSNRSPDIDPKGKALDFSDAMKTPGQDDPFCIPKSGYRQLSGMSQGMSSPFYDASTGAGIDRIENKDIVALMQHLMVRDAQRSARDTEIVALLMNAALEMRNSFREMKEMIQDTGDDVIFASAENTEKLQKAINGPRPYPGTVNRSIQSSQQVMMNETETKKRNLWKRALAGLGSKGTSDLTRIEDMLVQLLGEVDILKTQTAQPGVAASTNSGAASGSVPSNRPGSVSGGVPVGDHCQSFEDIQPEVQYEQDGGYEPEGASTASYASRSGHLSIPPSRGQTIRSNADRKSTDNRVSTVPEDEDEYAYEASAHAADQTQNQNQSQGRLSALPDSPSNPASSSQQGQNSNSDNTPRTDKGKKSGWLPKISRWSESTATSVGKVLRGNGKRDSKPEDQPPPSRSGSSVGSYDQGYEFEHDPYGEDQLHSGFSEPNLVGSQEPEEQDQAKSSVATTEDPKYRAHRNSLNLQHPQPRPGPTERFRTALEYSAQAYMDPATPKSADWNASVTSIDRLPDSQQYNQSSVGGRDGEYWTRSPSSQAQAGPPRPPKEPLDRKGGVTPTRSRISKLAAKSSPLQQYHSQNYDDGHEYHSPTGSPKPENRNLDTALGITRRPSGPRAMTPKSPEDEAAREERRRKRDTFGSMASQETDTF